MAKLTTGAEARIEPGEKVEGHPVYSSPFWRLEKPLPERLSSLQPGPAPGVIEVSKRRPANFA